MVNNKIIQELEVTNNSGIDIKKGAAKFFDRPLRGIAYNAEFTPKIISINHPSPRQAMRKNSPQMMMADFSSEGVSASEMKANKESTRTYRLNSVLCY